MPPGQDINQPNSCCPDDQYCYVNSTGQAACCALGSNCDNPCSTSALYLCGTIRATGTASASPSCCQRPCSATDAYQCANSFGGGCCNLGFSCTTSACISTATTPTTLVQVVPSGCTTGQFSCPSSIGGGCCNSGATCTNSDTTLLCASGTTAPSALRTGADGMPVSGITQSSPDSGLSTGAKAGIGVGITLFACLVVAGLLWFCMRRRKAARQAQASSRQSDSLSGPAQSMSQSGAVKAHGKTDNSGPVARSGPYTDYWSPGSQPNRGVPLSPESPGDIVGAVEIGHSRENSNVTSPSEIIEQNMNADYLTEVPENPEHRVELP